MYSDRAAYRLKATSAGVTATGYTLNVAVASSDLNEHAKDSKEAITNNVPGDIRENLDANGVYNTLPDRSRLTNDTSTTAAKRVCNHSKNSSNKKVQKPAHL